MTAMGHASQGDAAASAQRSGQVLQPLPQRSIAYNTKSIRNANAAA
jgi:hypothetical protein